MCEYAANTGSIENLVFYNYNKGYINSPVIENIPHGSTSENQDISTENMKMIVFFSYKKMIV